VIGMLVAVRGAVVVPVESTHSSTLSM